MRLARNSWFALLSLAVAGAGGAAHAGGRVLDGQAAPEIRLTEGLNGASSSTTLASLRGKVVLVKFWLPRCPICRGTLPEFQSLHDRYGRSGAVCLSIVIENAAAIEPYVRESGWTFPVGCDPQHTSADAYGVQRYPADYVVGVDGVVRASNGFPRNVIEDELKRHRLAELGEVPESMKGVRDAVAENDYGEALRRAESLAKAEGATDAVRRVAVRVADLARARQDNRFARADAKAAVGDVAGAKADLDRVVADFRDTSLEARAKERLAALSAKSPK